MTKPPFQPKQQPARTTHEQTLPTFPKVAYFNGDILNERLLDEDAEQQAQKLAPVSPTQLRRFFEDILAFKRRIDSRRELNPDLAEDHIFAQVRPEFRMLRAKAVYAHSRAKSNEKYKLLPLRDFLLQHTASVETARDFRAFCKHFEAVVAFHKHYFQDKESR